MTYPVFDTARADFEPDFPPIGTAASEQEALAVLRRSMGDDAPAAVEFEAVSLDRHPAGWYPLP